MSHPKQSIHTALKGLVNDGYVILESQERDRRSKHIHLTDKGISLAQNTADQIVQAENKAFSALTDEERKTFLYQFDRLTSALYGEMQKLK